MLWRELYDSAHEPAEAQISAFVHTPLWGELTVYLQQTYHVQSALFYSNCTMENRDWQGWNIKYKKGGKALCALYPKKGYFIALIAVAAKKLTEADLLMPLCETYTQALYQQTKTGYFGKSLPIAVTDEGILRDVKKLISLR